MRMLPIPPLVRLALLCATCALLACCGGPRPAPDVLLVTIDTLRPDALGILDSRRETPAIDALAASGYLFPAAVSPVPLTLPSHASMLSGRWPVHHGVRDNGQSVPIDVPMLQERLKQSGYRTAAFVSGFPLQAMFGLDRGFELYDDDMNDGEQGWVERRAEDTVQAVLGWWTRSGDSPTFTWVHFYDPHDPYAPPREFWQAGEHGAYYGEVSYTDYWAGKLLEAARARSGARSLLVVLTADHGEALGEHQENTHGYFIYDSTMRVPLIVSWPDHTQSGRSDAPMQLVDIAPTVLELLKLPALEGIDGRSFAAGLASGDLAAHPARMETWLPWTYYGWAPLEAWLDGNWKLIASPSPELYKLDADPSEANNRIAEDVVNTDRLGVALAQSTREAARVATTTSDEAAMQRLRSLGYVGVGGPVEAPSGNLADPKSRLQMRDRLQEGERLLRANQFVDAREVFAEVLKTDPDSRFANLRLGICLLRLGQNAEAVEVLKHAVEVEPRRAEARYALGDALMRTEKFAAAAEQWAALAELQPRRKEAWFNLGAALEKDGQPDQAGSAMQEYRRLSDSEKSAGSPPKSAQ
ncbi:MAG: tetratricopeptide repeat protein [Gammaproteobacteria bacterium]|nr:MAG: tetratricopeptide repeat protein [Gammaproteobacteria bacterium]